MLTGSGSSICYFFGDINQDLRARSTRASVLPPTGVGIRPPGNRSQSALAGLTWPCGIPGDLGELNQLQQRVAPALVGRAGVELPEALVGGVEHGGEDRVVERELGVVGLAGAGLTGARLTGARLTGARLTGAGLTGAADAAGRGAHQRRAVPVEDVRGAPRHRQTQD